MARVAVRASLTPQLQRRFTVEDVADIRGGVLIKNGKLTSCTLGPINAMMGFVSASCLDYYAGTKNLNTTTKYEVYINDGRDKPVGYYRVVNKQVNPWYDPYSGANNIAVVDYNFDNNDEFDMTIAVLLPEWDSVLYVQRDLKDVSTATWDAPRLLEGKTGKSDAVCPSLYNQFASAEDALACYDTAKDPPDTAPNSCKVPYPVAYASYKGKLYLAGLLSHMAVDGGTNLCQYIEEKEECFNVTYLETDQNVKPQSRWNWSMPSPEGANVRAGAHLLMGDFYDTSLVERQDAEVGNKWPQRATVAISVVGAIAGVLLLVLVGIAVKYWQIQKAHGRDPMRETIAHAILAHNLGGSSIPALLRTEDSDHTRHPPAYSHSSPAVDGAPSASNIAGSGIATPLVIHEANQESPVNEKKT
ncbi:hypothetical protein GGF46_000342 [Coemansia sp. RSA 552]|nr:hypothetical protein GGF46_000342 [Coemansia sp. RSA 552]